MTCAAAILKFNRELDSSTLSLPEGINVMNPFRENPLIRETAKLFYHKFYNDESSRILMLGINPGRFGAGMTGIPFTDPKRLVSVCGLPYEGKITHEPSSGFIYDMINAYGGPLKFYREVYINSLFPLIVIKQGSNGSFKNYNYYDDTDLLARLKPSIIINIRKQSEIAGESTTCICLGTGKNAEILRRLNDDHGFFKRIIALEHPRFIVQYKNKERDAYVSRYLQVLSDVKL